MWVAIFGAIALAGVIMLVCYGIWLWHKVEDLFSELDMLSKRADEMAALLDRVRVPDFEHAQPEHNRRPSRGSR